MEDKIVGISIKFKTTDIARMRREVARRMLATGQLFTLAELIRETMEKSIPPVSQTQIKL